MNLPSNDLLSPTTRLPPIKSIQTTPIPELSSSVEYLRFLYNPEVRGSRRRRDNGSKHSVRERDDAVSAIRADAFERSHAIRWLTSLVARGDSFVMSRSDTDVVVDSDSDGINLIDAASALLAACAGTAASGCLSRTYALGPSQSGEEATLKLTDAPLENGDYASVGAQTWGGACVMAEMVFEDPEHFTLPRSRGKMDKPDKVYRVLELGAGTGLVGLSIAKLLELRNVRTDMVLTDIHPSVLSNLRSNVIANFPSSTSCIDVSVVPLDWSIYSYKDVSKEKGSLGEFDLIVGADIVYETAHAVWIKACLEKLLAPDGLFHLIVPLRRTHTVESRTIDQVFGAESSGTGLRIVHQKNFICDAHSDANSRMWDRAEEVEYAYYRVGWKIGTLNSC